jgi:hypothetical protein
MATADKRAEDRIFDHVVVVPFDAPDQRELTALFGADLTQADARPRSGAGPADGRRSDAKKEGKIAVATAISPWRTPPSSKDIRQYLDGRHERPAATVAILLMLRPTPN